MRALGVFLYRVVAKRLTFPDATGIFSVPKRVFIGLALPQRNEPKLSNSPFNTPSPVNNRVSTAPLMKPSSNRAAYLKVTRRMGVANY